ncbi:MAG: MFS transporter [Blastocatellia bacterium]
MPSSPQVGSSRYSRRVSSSACATSILFLVFCARLIVWPSGSSAQDSLAQSALAILEKNCLACHGESRMANLDLRGRESALKGGERGPAIIPGKSADSPVIKAVTGGNGLMKMPPGKKSLAAEEIKILREGIDAGAQWPGAVTGSPEPSWWSFRKPVRPPIPAVKNAAWVKNPIDAFILRELEQKKLSPAPPAVYQGTVMRTQGTPFLNITPPEQITGVEQRDLLDRLKWLNHRHLETRADDSNLSARIASYELAFRLQTEAPELADLSKETEATKRLYGVDRPESRDFGLKCLAARRLAERGVRFIQLYSGTSDDNDDWDTHQRNDEGQRRMSLRVDKPISGLLADLKQRGMLDSTLVVWGGGFGRTPVTDGNLQSGNGSNSGRDHNPYGFTMWMAGGGVRGGQVIGATDELGFKAVEDPFHVHDFHATLLLAASVINYIDRQTLSILATTIQRELLISDIAYARVVQAFLFAYTFAYLLSGRIVDRFGPRAAQTGFLVWWSIANMLTGLATGFLSLAVFRSLLGLGEPGNNTASAKAISQWFPAREKGVAVGVYTMGGTLGAALAAPLVAFLALRFGWRMAFVITGAAGLLLAVVWAALYRRPAEHPMLGESERRLLSEAGVLNLKHAAQPAPRLRELFGLKPMWLMLAVRMTTDPVWYFYLFWFSKYLQEQRGFTLLEIGQWLWVIFIAADAGCLVSGWASGRLIRRGSSPVWARLRVMAVAAALMAFSAALPFVPGKLWPLLLASVFCFAALAWITMCVTLPIDIFPSSAVGSVHGMIGTGGSLGGAFSTGLIGWAVTNFSYSSVFTAMSFLHPLAWVMAALLLPRLAAKMKSS